MVMFGAPPRFGAEMAADSGGIGSWDGAVATTEAILLRFSPAAKAVDRCCRWECVWLCFALISYQYFCHFFHIIPF